MCKLVKYVSQGSSQVYFIDAKCWKYFLLKQLGFKMIGLEVKIMNALKKTRLMY